MYFLGDICELCSNEDTIPTSCTVYGYDGSSIQEYCNTYSHDFICINKLQIDAGLGGGIYVDYISDKYCNILYVPLYNNDLKRIIDNRIPTQFEPISGHIDRKFLNPDIEETSEVEEYVYKEGDTLYIKATGAFIKQIGDTLYIGVNNI